ncbi:hypothetical protein D3C81_1861870 [compost metagenome]
MLQGFQQGPLIGQAQVACLLQTVAGEAARFQFGQAEMQAHGLVQGQVGVDQCGQPCGRLKVATRGQGGVVQ